MYKTVIILSAILIAACSTLSNVSINQMMGKPSQVIVTLDGIGNENGNLVVVIHDNQYSYYNDGNLNKSNIGYYKIHEIPAKSPSMRVEFNDIPAGKYAISAFHDENGDRKLNRMILPFTGMPSESYGISNNSFAYFSKGPFEDALIDIGFPTTSITIKLSHHLEKIGGN